MDICSRKYWHNHKSAFIFVKLCSLLQPLFISFSPGPQNIQASSICFSFLFFPSCLTAFSKGDGLSLKTCFSSVRLLRGIINVCWNWLNFCRLIFYYCLFVSKKHVNKARAYIFQLTKEWNKLMVLIVMINNFTIPRIASIILLYFFTNVKIYLLFILVNLWKHAS